MCWLKDRPPNGGDGGRSLYPHFHIIFDAGCVGGGEPIHSLAMCNVYRTNRYEGRGGKDMDGSEGREHIAHMQIDAVSRCLDAEAACGRGEACIFTLTTAIRLLGVDWDPLTAVKPWWRLGAELLQVVVGDKNNKPRDRLAKQRPGTRQGRYPATFFTSGIPIETVEVADGVTCTTPEFTWFMFARFLDLEELVILGDAMMRRYALHDQVTLESFEDLLCQIERYGSEHGMRAPKGIRNCRRALALMEEGTDSVRESILRLLLIRYGLPRPVVNYPLVLPDGTLVFLDIAFPDARVDVEYDGRFHQNQWAQDAQRRLAIELAGWAYVQVTDEALATKDACRQIAELVARYLKERTGNDYLRDEPFDLRAVADGRRKGWKRR